MYVQILGADGAVAARLSAILELYELTTEQSGAPDAVLLAGPAPADFPLGVPLVTLQGVTPPPGAQAVAELAEPLRAAAVARALHAVRVAASAASEDALPDPKQVVALASVPGVHPLLDGLRRAVLRAAAQPGAALIQGPTGAGKRRIARVLHDCSARATLPFLPMNCATFPEPLLQAEILGCEQGALPGAMSCRTGRIELAEGGTLLLEDVECLSVQAQASLLGYLRSGRLERLGATRGVRCDTRIVATSSVALDERVTRGEFREDLFFALQASLINVPPLRSYVEALPEVLAHVAPELDAGALDAAAWQALASYSWPGNLTELANCGAQLATLSGRQVLGRDELPAFVLSGAASQQVDEPVRGAGSDAAAECTLDEYPLLPINGINLKEYLANLEKSLINQALEDTGSVVARAADRLHVRRTTLVEKMRKYGLQRS